MSLKCKIGKHSWETINSTFAKAHYGNIFGKDYDIDMIVVLQRCKLCLKERAFGNTPMGSEDLSLSYVKTIMKWR